MHSILHCPAPAQYAVRRPCRTHRRYQNPRFVTNALPSSLYELLGVSKDVSHSELKATYRQLASKLHPDVNPAAGKKFMVRGIWGTFWCTIQSDMIQPRTCHFKFNPHASRGCSHATHCGHHALNNMLFGALVYRRPCSWPTKC